MELKTQDVVSTFNLLSNGKLTKMESSDKFKVLKMMRVMQPIADEWESFMKHVDEKLKKDNHDEIVEKVKQWQQEGENTTLTEAERIEINKYFAEYQQEKNDCINDELKKVVSLSFDKINESAFEKLVDSNDWEVIKILELEKVIKE